MAVRRSTEPVRYNNDLNGSKYDAENNPQKRQNRNTIKLMSARNSYKSAPRTSNADSVAEQFLVEDEK